MAASLEDPKLSLTALPAPIATAAGRQNVIVGITQKAPIREKQLRKEASARLSLLDVLLLCGPLGIFRSELRGRD